MEILLFALFLTYITSKLVRLLFLYKRIRKHEQTHCYQNANDHHYLSFYNFLPSLPTTSLLHAIKLNGDFWMMDGCPNRTKTKNKMLSSFNFQPYGYAYIDPYCPLNSSLGQSASLSFQLFLFPCFGNSSKPKSLSFILPAATLHY